MGTFPDDLDHYGSLKRSSSRRPLKILTLLKGVPAPPVLTPPTSPLDFAITSNLESGSEALYLDDGGALIYHMPEPSTASVSMFAPCVIRCLVFPLLTPIMECSEPSDLLPWLTSSASQGDLSEIQGSLSTVSLHPPTCESVSHCDLVLPLPSSAERISHFAHLDSIDSGLNDNDLVLPIPCQETFPDTMEIKVPSPGRSHIDSMAFRRLLNSNGKDIEENSTLDIKTVPAGNLRLTALSRR